MARAPQSARSAAAPSEVRSGRPGTVVAGCVLWALAGLLNLVGAILVLGAALKLGGSYPAVAGVSIAVAVAQLAFTVLAFLGRRWARVVLTVFAVLALVIGIAGALSGQLFSLVGLVLVVIATVLLYTPAAAGFFRRS